MSDTREEEYEQTEARRDVHMDRERYESFQELQGTEESPFYTASNQALFLFAAGYGRKYAVPESTDDEVAVFGRNTLSQEQRRAIEAVAVRKEADVDVLHDQRRVYRIAQEYANAGIQELYGRVFGPEDALTELTVELQEEVAQVGEDDD